MAGAQIWLDDCLAVAMLGLEDALLIRQLQAYGVHSLDRTLDGLPLVAAEIGIRLLSIYL